MSTAAQTLLRPVIRTLLTATALIGLSACQSLPWRADAPAAETARAVDESHVWDLTDLYADDAAWDAAHAQLGARVTGLTELRGTLGRSARSLLTASDTISAVEKDVIRLLVYATLKADVDTRVASNEERRQLSRALLSDLNAAVSWYRPEVLAIGETKVRRFIAAEPGLAPHRFRLEKILHEAPHTRSAEVETVLAQAGKLSGAPGSIYNLLTNANMPWPEITLRDGKTLRLDQAAYTHARQLPDRADRKAVFETFWGTWKGYEASLGGMLGSQVQGRIFETKARGFDTSLQRALYPENMPEAVYRTLITEVNAALPTLHRYFKLRKRMLGIDDDALRYYDIYPPLVELDTHYGIDESIALTRRALAPLGDDYLNIYDRGVAENWMHIYPQPGKRSGAYMFGAAYDVHPYVFLNHNDDWDSASTFAHEYGHAVHSVLANTAQPWENADYATAIAETASIMNEMLLQDMVLAAAKTKEEQLYYLGASLESMRGTFFRQTMFAEFELAINEAVERGEALTGAKLSEIYLGLLRRYHGHDQGVMDIEDLYGIEWAYIPHFYRDFYVYSYATSIAAAAEFAQKVGSGNAAARKAFIDMLKAGGSDYPYTLMATAGVDLATPAPYRALVARMNQTMDRMEALLEQ